MSVTKAAQYNLRPPATAGRSYSYKVQPQDGSAEIPGSRTKVVEFHIPCSANTFLDQSQTYLEMKVKNTSINSGSSSNISASFDGSAASLIHRLEIFHGANLLESIDNYNVLHALMMDLTVGEDQRNHAANALMGCAAGTTISSTITNFTPANLSGVNVPNTDMTYGLHSGSITSGANPTVGNLTVDADTDTAAKVSGVLTKAEGDELNNNINALHSWASGSLDGISSQGTRKGSVIGTSTPSQIAMPIALSALLSVVSKKYLPLFAMQADSLRLQLTLEDPAAGIVTLANTPGYTISEVGLVCQFVELQSEVCGAILGDALANGGGALRISTESFRSFQTSMTAPNFSIQVPARFSSLNSLFTSFRNSDDVINSAKASISDRVFPNEGISYQYRLGSTLLPSAPVKSKEMSLMEVLKCQNAVAVGNFNTMVNAVNWGSNTTGGTFCIGLETSLFAHANDVVDSGKQTISEVVNLEGQTGPAGTKNFTVDTFARFDTALIVSDGLATTVF